MAEKVLKVEFPQGKIYTLDDKYGTAYIEYNKNYVNKFNTDINKVQVFYDNKVIMNLQEYVSFKTGTQAKSIRLTSDAGSGIVWINVPYARYQAYSPKIKKRVGKRGTYPFERMKADLGSTMLKQVAEYSRMLNGQ